MRTREVERRKTKVGKGGVTKQSMRDECDINVIMKKYVKTGVITHLSNKQGKYGDFSDVADYQTALNKVIAAQEAFEGLPAEVRRKFRNDPGELIDFLNDPKNIDEAVKIGLVEKVKEVDNVVDTVGGDRSKSPLAGPGDSPGKPA